jgi:hypothetical protein
MNFQNLISSLANKGARPALEKPFLSFVFCVVFLAIYLVILLQIFGLRNDFASAITEQSLQIELFLNVATILASIAAIVFLRLPRLNENSLINFIAVAFFIMFFLSLCFVCCIEEGLNCLSDLSCLIGIILFSLIPLVFLTAILKRGVLTNYFFSFLLVGIASGSFSYLVERLVNSTEHKMHLILWHFAPIFIVILLSLLLIKMTVKKL